MQIWKRESHRRASCVSIACLGSILLAGCYSRPISEADKALAETAVLEQLREFERAENERNADALLSFLDTGFYMYQDGKRVGYDEVVDQIKRTLPSLQSFEARFEEVQVEVLSRDAALVSILFFDKILDGEGNETEMWGPTTFLWKRQGAEWKLAYADSDHYPVE